MHVESGRYVVEMTPAWGSRESDRGVVATGPVGAIWLGRSALFRYEVRRWREGVIPDALEAVSSPQTLSCAPGRAERLLELVPRVPRATWGRDELRTGEMWNSNSLVSWLLSLTGHNMRTIGPPGNGRTPGWKAGLVLAARQRAASGDLGRLSA